MKYIINIDLTNPINVSERENVYVDIDNGMTWTISKSGLKKLKPLKDHETQMDEKRWRKMTNDVSEDITKAITDSKTERVEQKPKMVGWICPVCGRGLSPFTRVCPCRNDGKGWEITCQI